MNIFLSWHGERSLATAKAFHEWLPSIFTFARIFFSPEMEKGTRPLETLAKELSETNFGIVCLTPENRESTWIHYEAGALTKLKDDNRLWTFLMELKPTDIVPPLSQFQHTVSSKEEIFRLVKSINGNSGEHKLAQDLLTKLFEKWWPDLELELERIRKTTVSGFQTHKEIRSEREIVEEILERVGHLQRVQMKSNPQKGIGLIAEQLLAKRDQLPSTTGWMNKAHIVVKGEDAREKALVIQKRINSLISNAKFTSERVSKEDSVILNWEFDEPYLMSAFEAAMQVVDDEDLGKSGSSDLMGSQLPMYKRLLGRETNKGDPIRSPFSHGPRVVNRAFGLGVLTTAGLPRRVRDAVWHF